MKSMRMHHVGIILPTMKSAHKFLETFDLEIDYQGFVEAYQADLIFTKYTENESPVELIIPEEGSVLKDFNKGKGGIAHIAFEVEDVEAVREEFESKGMEMLEGSAVPGTSDIIVNFVRPKYTQGILVEYVQTVGPIQR
jgi:lactoylglutathione lyase/methylmalonyl-CoA/ethylmalonyl-CoA epimerase